MITSNLVLSMQWQNNLSDLFQFLILANHPLIHVKQMQPLLESSIVWQLTPADTKICFAITSKADDALKTLGSVK